MAKQFFAEPGLKKNEGKKLLKNARIFDPESGYDEIGELLIIDDKIADFGPNLGAIEGAEEVDCGGHLLTPGLIDIQAHCREPGQEKKETLETGTRSAAAGGVTGIGIMPNTTPVIDNVQVVEFIKSKVREKAIANVHIFGCITKGMKGDELTEMGLLKEAGVIGFTDDGLPAESSLIMRKALEYAGELGLVVSQHAEDLVLTNGGCINEGLVSAKLGVRGISNATESIIVQRDIELLRLVQKNTGKGKYHVLHVSTKESVEALRRAKEEGLNVTFEVSPHHFTLTDQAVEDYKTFAKMNPPLRDEESRAAVYEALTSGLADAIATDHAPHDEESKRLPLQDAAFGIVGLETFLPLSLAVYHKGDMGLKDLLARMTYKPADIIGVEGGRIKKDAVADLTLIDLDMDWVIKPEEFSSKSKNSPFNNHKTKGRAIKTFIGGQLVYELG